MASVEFLLKNKRNLIQIDKTNKDYSELEQVIDRYNKSGLAKPKTIFVAYKQDIEKNIEEPDYVRIDLDETSFQNIYNVVISSKEVKHKVFKYKFEITEFIKKFF